MELARLRAEVRESFSTGSKAEPLRSVFFFVNDHKRYCHFIWHLFVLDGTFCHYFAVLSYAA